MISHDLTRTAKLADEVSVLKHGRIIATGQVREVMTSSILSDAYGLDVNVRDIEGALSITRADG